MYLVDLLIRDGWARFPMHARIYFQVKMWHMRHGNKSMEIHIQSLDGLELKEPSPESRLITELVIQLCKQGIGRHLVVTCEYLSGLPRDYAPAASAEERLMLLNKYIQREETHRLKNRAETWVKTQVARRPAVIVLDSSGEYDPIELHVLAPLGWRWHRIIRWFQGWRRSRS